MAAISFLGTKAGTGILQSTLSPKYLHTNSTSHTWPFSAIAELIDNAYDPDVKASQLWINKLQLRGKTCLSFTDNGNGMTPEKLHKMLSFGFCEKVADGTHMPVGHYGNGFKSGSMRLGKNALVLTKQENSRSIGYLSQTYLEMIQAETVLVPIVTWDAKPNLVIRGEGQKAFEDILKYSLLRSETEVTEQFDLIPESHGTRIIISNIRKTADNKSEFDFLTDEYDIRIPDDADTEGGKYRQTKRQNHIPECDYSLKAYCAILYLKPKMQIFLRRKKVKTMVVEKSLSKTEVDRYKPQGLSEPVKVVFGFNSKNKNHYGIMMYHRNRLIKPYERVGHQLKANNLGVGVVGVVQCDFLQPTHNKQDFDYTKTYRTCMSALGNKLNDYWNEKRGPARSVNNSQVIPEPPEIKSLPDQNWVQCDRPSCLRWRKMPDFVDPDALPDKWYCHMNPDINHKSCDVPEEKDDDPATITPYAKVQKKRLEKELQERSKKDKEEKIAQFVEQEEKKQRLQEKEESLRKKEEQLNKHIAALHQQQTPVGTIKSENSPKLPTAQVLPRPTMVKMKPLNAMSPAGNKLASRVPQSSSQSARSPTKSVTPIPRVSPASQSYPRPASASQSTPSPVKTSQSPRRLFASPLTPVSTKPSPSTLFPTVNPKPADINQTIKIVAKSPASTVDTSRLTFKVMKSSNGNTFLVQSKAQQVPNANYLSSSSSVVGPVVSVAATTPQIVAIGVTRAPRNLANVNKPSSTLPLATLKEVPRSSNVDIKPRSVVLPKPQTPVTAATLPRSAPLITDSLRFVVSNTQAPSILPSKTTAVTPVKPTAAVPAAAFPQIVSAISTTATSPEHIKPLQKPGIKRESSNNMVCPVPAKSPKTIDAVIVIDPLPPQTSEKEQALSKLVAELKDKKDKLQLQLDEKTKEFIKRAREMRLKLDEKSTQVSGKTAQLILKTSEFNLKMTEYRKLTTQLNTAKNELGQKTRDVFEKTKQLNEKNKQLASLRANVCRLLQVLVPEIDVNSEQGEGEKETVDELLRQVLEANQ